MKTAVASILSCVLVSGLLSCGKPAGYKPQAALAADLGDESGTTEPNPLPTQSPGPQTPNFAALAGVYGGGSGVQVVLPTGEYWTWGGYGILFMKYGQLASASAGSFTGAITAGNTTPGAMSGTYSPGVSFNGGNRASGTAPSFAATVGTWWGNIQDGDTPYLDFTANGHISGQSANFHCNFSGDMQPDPSGLSVFKVTIKKSNCLGSGTSETYTGIVRVTGALLHLVALNPGKTKTLTWEAYKL